MRTKKNPRALVNQKPGAPALLGRSLSPTPPCQDPEGPSRTAHTPAGRHQGPDWGQVDEGTTSLPDPALC